MAIGLKTLYPKLVDKVYEDDLISQETYLSLIEEQRKIPVSYLLDRGFLFIPNNDYIYHYLGAEADTHGAELCANGRCFWTLYVTIPITDLANDVVGLVGWDVQNKFLEVSEGQKGLPMYKVSSKRVFSRERYFLADNQVLKSTFPSRTIFITDGVFDSVSLNYRGIPAIALLGSTVSREVLYFLRWYSKVYVIADNDDAGNKLYGRLRNALGKVRRVKQNRTKDIEELLREDGKSGPITQQLRQLMSAEGFDDYTLKLS